MYSYSMAILFGGRLSRSSYHPATRGPSRHSEIDSRAIRERSTAGLEAAVPDAVRFTRGRLCGSRGAPIRFARSTAKRVTTDRPFEAGVRACCRRPPARGGGRTHKRLPSRPAMLFPSASLTRRGWRPGAMCWCSDPRVRRPCGKTSVQTMRLGGTSREGRLSMRARRRWRSRSGESEAIPLERRRLRRWPLAGDRRRA